MRLTVKQRNSKKRILLSFSLRMVWISLVLCLICSASYSLAQSEKPSVSPAGQNMEERWGIKPLSIRPTADGFFVDFRYRIVDAEKSAPLFSPTIKPLLIDENTGAIMAVPTVPKVGSMRSTRKPLQGRNYAILFANPNKHIKPGHKVTVVIGDYKAEHLIVEGEESSLASKQSTGGNGSGQGFTDPNRPIEVQKGQKFTIVLDSNRTTGYRWELTHTPDTGIVEVIESQYEAPDTQKIGSGGREIWTFVTKNAGKTKINFKYVRPWEEQAGPVKTTSFEIIVE
jgi:predicted secreted protein